MKQCIGQEYLFDGSHSPLPVKNGVLGYVENPAHGIQPNAFGSRVEHINDDADACSYSCQECILGRGEKFHASLALHDWSLSIILSFVS